jgi:hypothetical protein
MVDTDTKPMSLAENRETDRNVRKRVIQLAHCLNGHVHGDYASLGCIHGEAVYRLIVTLPYGVTRYFASLVKLDYKNSDTLATSGGDCYDIIVRDNSLVVCVSPHRTTPLLRVMGTLTYKFDYQMLSTSSTRLYINPNVCDGDSASFEDVLHRVINKRFSVLSMCPSVSSPMGVSYHMNAMFTAYERVSKHGWKMDDHVHPSKSWVVNTWSDVGNKKYHHCPLCYDAFKNGDVVIGLPCEHLFHLFCDGNDSASTGNGGLMAWLRQGNGSCPCCRKDMYISN